MKTDLRGLTHDEIQEYLEPMGLKPFRTKQILDWIYCKKVKSIDEMTNLSKDLREALKKKFYIPSLILLQKQVSQDGTEKFLFEMGDKKQVETVLIPDGKRVTLCISTQVGCKFSCSFCYTGKMGFKRNLTTSEIINQIIYATQNNENATNIVLMGMGEPLDNYDNVIKAIKIIHFPWGLGISARKISLSTCGLIRGINKLEKENLNINLMISLNASDNKKRNLLMPVNKKYPLEKLMSACREYTVNPKNQITFEYVLIKNINDSEKDAKALVSLIKGIRCKINLIPFNKRSDENWPYDPPEKEKVNKFQEYLISQKYLVFLRKQRGLDICASCGQLTGQY